MNLDAAKRFLRTRLGLHFEGSAELRLKSALAGRIGAAGDAGLADYLARLPHDPAELGVLAGLLTVKESYFYREPQHLRLLTEHLAPLLLQARGVAAPVRILSAGCAEGEEAYSIAIALRERWGECAARRFHIEAADLDPEAIARARAGRYRPWSLRGLDPILAARWFGPAAHGTRELAPAIRQAVAFRTLNLVADPLPDELRGLDLIFYRNLSIYFDAATREAVLRRLRTLLCPGGYLIVGTAETLANGSGPFSLCEHAGVWFFQERGAGILPAQAPLPAPAPPTEGPTPGSRPAPPQPPTVPAAADSGPPAPPPAPPPAERYQQALDLAQAEQFAAAAAVLAPACAAPDASPAHLLLAAALLAEAGDTVGAAAAARRVLAADPWSAEAQVLLGRLAHRRGDLRAAAEHLRRAVYACPDHWPAHFALAEVRAAAGQAAAAGREYRIVLRLLGHAGAARAGPLPACLPLADLRRLCRARLMRLGDPV